MCPPFSFHVRRGLKPPCISLPGFSSTVFFSFMSVFLLQREAKPMTPVPWNKGHLNSLYTFGSGTLSLVVGRSCSVSELCAGTSHTSRVNPLLSPTHRPPAPAGTPAFPGLMGAWWGPRPCCCPDERPRHSSCPRTCNPLTSEAHFISDFHI